MFPLPRMNLEVRKMSDYSEQLIKALLLRKSRKIGIIK